MPEILIVPTPARSPEEKKLLEEIARDFDLKNPELKERIKTHAKSTSYVLTVWRHSAANLFFYSFENKDDVNNTRNSYKTSEYRPEPKIMGIMEVE
jgi:hypothetical protein